MRVGYFITNTNANNLDSAAIKVSFVSLKSDSLRSFFFCLYLVKLDLLQDTSIKPYDQFWKLLYAISRTKDSNCQETPRINKQTNTTFHYDNFIPHVSLIVPSKQTPLGSIETYWPILPTLRTLLRPSTICFFPSNIVFAKKIVFWLL